MTDTAAILAERHKRYGDFYEQAGIALAIRRPIINRERWHSLAPDMQEALLMITIKIARIMNGDPAYADNWADIAGYATLVADRLEGVKQ